jgi:hypothetical protein
MVELTPVRLRVSVEWCGRKPGYEAAPLVDEKISKFK